MKSENGFCCSPSCETTTTFMEVFLCHDRSYAGEKSKLPQDCHIAHIQADVYLSSCTETANAALQNSKLHLSKITQMSETEDVNEASL